ncbi:MULTISPECIES: DapH/DapD/GlmU-related protein [Bacillus cereus group]|uniref:DapH/DapD/GlmU-related protein n=1 Tax=Bacillus cereus group TaxID=86661 RepID=UPI000678FF1B|nr:MULTISPECIES: DapH/DapD/GlmU-related protein [Bacillus cereus group]MCE9758251.1 hypothetical protein [Bacillus cereus]HDR7992365.1 hypothetical protein [Bacillus cereus]
MLKIIIDEFIDYHHFFLKNIFKDEKKPWIILNRIPEIFREIFANKSIFVKEHKLFTGNEILNNNFTDSGAFVNENNVFIGEGSRIEAGAYVKGPAIIGNNVTIRSGAYIRENVIIGDNCIIGHASEIKHSILLNDAKAPHFNYVGNSIIGNNVNLGAGAICSNLKYLPYGGDIYVTLAGEKLSTDSRYFGCLVGDNSKIGCNVVINPGTIIGRNVISYPAIAIRGTVEHDSLVKETFKICKIKFNKERNY